MFALSTGQHICQPRKLFANLGKYIESRLEPACMCCFGYMWTAVLNRYHRWGMT